LVSATIAKLYEREIIVTDLEENLHFITETAEINERKLVF
jgi:hypothetical protein